MTDLDYLTHLARETTRFAEVITQTRPKARVPTCPEWDADDLLWHLGEVQWLWGTIVGRRLTALEDVDVVDTSGRPSRPSERDGLLAFFGRSSADLQHNLSSVPPETAAWTWSDEQSVGFIRRRQAHEALIHRLDAELTAGDRTAMDAGLCTDGVDEVLHIMYGGTQSWGRFTPDPTQTVAVHTTDTDRSWLVTWASSPGQTLMGRPTTSPTSRWLPRTTVPWTPVSWQLPWCAGPPPTSTAGFGTGLQWVRSSEVATVWSSSASI